MPILIQGERLIMEGPARETAVLDLNGFLTLTNARLVYEKVEGFLSKKKTTIFQVGITSVYNCTVEGVLPKKLAVELNLNGMITKYLFQLSHAKEWDAALRATRQQR